MNKAQIREDMLARRKALPKEYARTASEAICSAIIESDVFAKSQTVLSYMPYGNEVAIKEVNLLLINTGKRLCVPRTLLNYDMEAVPVDHLGSDLIQARFGLLEPAPHKKAIKPEKIDLILIPGVAFDQTGNRLGHGRGYYDRFLLKCRKDAYKLGVAFDFQVLSALPFESYDIRMNAVVTEKAFIHFIRQEQL
ncbi:MAG: 5-formyltetrahydrofolate cyclo-ligase [Clostridia bacterium]|nr:5-formyltetrahydrofolate cyclo-ligase [Clostridia bacterium]